MTTLPPGFFIQTLTKSEWTTNTWITTTASDGSQTVVPVLVGCSECGTDGGGIVLWNLPHIPNVSFKFPDLPNLPQFALPCIRLLFFNLGNCPGPVTEPSDEDRDGDEHVSTSSPDSTPSKTAVTKSTVSTTSTQSCSITQTASNCIATCSPTKAGESSTITCYTTACHQTLTGCSVSGTTATITERSCPTSTVKGPEKRNPEMEGCPVVCPNWDLLEDLDTYDVAVNAVPDDEVIEPRQLAVAGRVLVPRANNGKSISFSKCSIDKSWPEGRMVRIPRYFGGQSLVKCEKAGFPGMDPISVQAYQDMPRWYSKTIAAAPACTP
nr:uncharacterized protein CTRU02_10585 [Colletotrichum truncatum]KAF6786886.1 hypothetical protein CTRU02_10585 [Colletotrichum truncatum]